MAAINPHHHAATISFDLLVSLLICSSVTEVTQQSKARHRDDFVVAFSPVIAEAMATAYKGATSDVQQKLRKVAVVWRERSIFEAPIQAAVEARIDGAYHTSPHASSATSNMSAQNWRRTEAPLRAPSSHPARPLYRWS